MQDLSCIIYKLTIVPKHRAYIVCCGHQLGYMSSNPCLQYSVLSSRVWRSTFDFLGVRVLSFLCATFAFLAPPVVFTSLESSPVSSALVTSSMRGSADLSLLPRKLVRLVNRPPLMGSCLWLLLQAESVLSLCFKLVVSGE